MNVTIFILVQERERDKRQLDEARHPPSQPDMRPFAHLVREPAEPHRQDVRSPQRIPAAKADER